MTDLHTYLMVAVIALVTAGLRFAPFLIFSGERKTPRFIQKLGALLPYAIMGMLVVYCIRNVRLSDVASIVPTLAACAVTAALYVWKRNTLISIVCGTLSYMFLVQAVF